MSSFMKTAFQTIQQKNIHHNARFGDAITHVEETAWTSQESFNWKRNRVFRTVSIFDVLEIELRLNGGHEVKESF